MIVLAITIALQQVGFNLTAFLTGLGIVGFTIGFALQDVSKNFVSGLLLLIQQPFNIGETIEVTGFTGTVISINLRATEMHTLDGRVVLIPNADVFTNPITNFSRAVARRVALEVGVDYESDLEGVRQVAINAIGSVHGLLGTPPPQITFQAFGLSAIEMTVYYWIDTVQTDPATAKDEGLVAMKGAFARAGIHMPYPTLPAGQITVGG
jgi:small conductance mechanosensitive channel